MRAVNVALLLLLSAAPALAQRAPVIVIPGRPDVPVLINGVDVSWCVIEGEFGLDRPGEMPLTVIYRPFAVPVAYGPAYYPSYSGHAHGYFPSTGGTPGYGRLEVVPPSDRPRPPAAPTFRQGWSTPSAPDSATEDAPFAAPQFFTKSRHNGRPDNQGGAQGSGKSRR